MIGRFESVSAAANASLAEIEVGGRRYPAVSEHRCRVCSSGPLRRRIEEETVDGRSWSSIAADLPADADLSPRNIRDHFCHGHLPVKEPTVQRVVETQAEQRGAVVERAIEVVVGHLDFCQTVVGRVNKRVVNGEVEPTVRDAIAAATVLARFDPGPGTDERDFVDAFLVYHQEVSEVLHPDQFTTLGQRLEGHPVLKRLGAKWEQAHEGTTIK